MLISGLPLRDLFSKCGLGSRSLHFGQGNQKFLMQVGLGTHQENTAINVDESF